MPRRRNRKVRVTRRPKPAGCLVTLENKTEIPSEFIHWLISWGLAFLKRMPGLRPQRNLNLTLRSMPPRKNALGRLGPRIKGWQVDNSILIKIVTDPSAYPASGRYSIFPEFPEYRLVCVSDALVAILIHELAHWHGVDGGKPDEFLCEVLSSAAVADYRTRYEGGTLKLGE
jgi:hypothetical protein